MQKTTRRELIVQGASAIGALTLGGTVTARPARAHANAPAKKVVVIGAGLAGLSAGYELIQLGHQVTILEARTRPGGRVLTLREPFADGLYAEAGALFLPDNHDLTMKYVRSFGLPLTLVRSRASAEMIYIRGKRIVLRGGNRPDWPLGLSTEERRLGLSGMWDKYIGFAFKEIGDPSAPGWPQESLQKYDRVTLSDLVRSRGASPDGLLLMRMMGIDLWGDGADTVSALYVLRDFALRESENKTYAIKGGNDQLPKAFAGKMKESIRYGVPVIKLEKVGDRIRVTFRQAHRERSIDADRVIAALPFPLLKRIEVKLGFSEKKQASIEQLLTTSVARLYVQCRRKFWEDDGIPASVSTDLPVQWMWEPTMMQPGQRGILEAHMAGPEARRVTGLNETARLDYALEQMEKVYPGLRENYEGGASKCWDEDEWARGDYAWCKPGQLSSMYQDIIRPEGGVHFAGDHASPWPGWMQGALHSGLRVAREVNSTT